eukprot:13074605-Alexandrium_andersonii.AAC.1
MAPGDERKGDKCEANGRDASCRARPGIEQVALPPHSPYGTPRRSAARGQPVGVLGHCIRVLAHT